MPDQANAAGGAEPPWPSGRPLVIGLTGGIAAGKSAVAAMFAARGFRHVDADAAARAASREPAVVAAVAAAFGPEVVVDGQLDRAALGRRVFADAGLRRRLEAILHPPILARIAAALSAAKAAGQPVLLDAPLLHETGLDALCDRIVFVAAPDEVRAERAAGRGWAAGELRQREAAQLPLAEKQARAHHTIDNGSSRWATEQQVVRLLGQLAAPRDT